MSFSRSDSRSTMSISCDCSSVSGSSCRRIWIDPDIDASGLRISWAMPGRHLADRRQPLLHARLALALARLGDVLEREHEAGLAARRHQRRRAEPELDLRGRRARVKPNSTRGSCGRPSRRPEQSRRTPPAAAALAARLADRLPRRHAGDRLGGAVEGEDPPVDVGRRQAARQAVDDVLAERLQVASWFDARCELRVGAAQALGQVAAQRRDRQEPEDVQADGEERDPQRRQIVRGRPRPAAPACRSTAPAPARRRAPS